MSGRAKLMLKTVLWWPTAAFGSLFAFSEFTGLKTSMLIAWRPLLCVTLYAVVLIIAKHTPGICCYRFWVLSEPSRHFPREIERARAFARFAGERILFGGLILTLMEIAVVLTTAAPETVAALLPGTLLASLYAMFLYMMMEKSSAQAAVAQRAR
jgi:hypothetical protein